MEIIYQIQQVVDHTTMTSSQQPSVSKGLRIGRVAHLLRHEPSCFELSRCGFTYPGSIPGQGKIMNVQLC